MEIDDARLEIAPAGSGADVTVGLAALTNFAFSYTNSAVLALDRGQNTSLTVMLTTGPSVNNARRGNATLVIVPASGELGNSERLKGALPQSNGLVPPSIVMQRGGPQQAANFLAYDNDVGLVAAKPTAPAGSTLQTAGGIRFFLATSPQTLTASSTVYALQVEDQPINLGSSTLSIGLPNSSLNGLILNGGSISGGTLKFWGEGLIYTSLAGSTIESSISASNLTFFGPGVATLGGDLSFNLGPATVTVNSGTLKVQGQLLGTVAVGQRATLAGSGRLSGEIRGGLISPGDGDGILTAGSVSTMSASAITGVPNPTNFAFQLGHTGLPDFAHPAASGNDLLRLTSATLPFSLSFDANNLISLYLDKPALQLGDTFYGGFYTDLRSDFTSSIEDATFRFYLLDPNGTQLFEGNSYSLASGIDFDISSVPLSADFGAGQIDGQIMQLQVVPEPSSLALLMSAVSAAVFLRPRRTRKTGSR